MQRGRLHANFKRMFKFTFPRFPGISGYDAALGRLPLHVASRDGEAEEAALELAAAAEVARVQPGTLLDGKSALEKLRKDAKNDLDLAGLVTSDKRNQTIGRTHFAKATCHGQHLLGIGSDVTTCHCCYGRENLACLGIWWAALCTFRMLCCAVRSYKNGYLQCVEAISAAWVGSSGRPLKLPRIL
jgi:hypothetical protein